MKKYPLIVLVLTFGVGSLLWRQPAETRSQSADIVPGRPSSSGAIAFGESAPLGSLGSQIQSNLKKAPTVREVGANSTGALIAGVSHDEDGALAKFGVVPMPTPIVSFPGLSDEDNTAVHSLFIMPADMNGDVGPNHYVQIVNSLIRVYDKNGAPLSDRLKISSVFQQLGTACATRDDGLPIVQYDTLADRWLISQTCVAFPPFRQMIAISKTGDPLGGYFLYEFVMPNIRLNDFPKFGVWPDGYYMSTDEYLGSDYVGAGAFAFDREKLLAGDPSASYVYFNLPVPVSPRRRGLLPSDLDGLRPPPPGAPNVFASYTATEYGDPQDALRLFDFHADFADPFSSTFTERSESPIAVADFDPTSPDGRADISQPPPGEKLDSQSDRLNYRLAYRNFGTHESLVVNQTVRSSPANADYNAGVRIYELRKSGTAYAVAEQATIGNPNFSRWIASTAQDHQGNLAVQYNFGNIDKKTSVLYTGKLATDPAGEFRTEGSLIDGTGVQKAFGWRWGEYSGMNVDPVDDCTFWMTNAYYSAESEEFSDFGWLTRIGSFKFPECTPVESGSITGIVTNASNSQPVPGAVVSATQYSRTAAADGNYGSLRVLPGTYQVTASASGFLPRSVSVTVGNGDVLNRNFALTPIPVIENPTAQMSAESCEINGAPEPGERVTFDIALQNTGVLFAANLTAAVLPSASVIDPGPIQSYGFLPAGGPAVTRQFSFTIAPSVECGSVVTINLELRDGGPVIGNIAIPIQTGVSRIALGENFDGVTAPTLPIGWTTTSSENHQLWRTSTARTQSVPNSLFSPAPHQMGINEAVTPEFAIQTSRAEIRFRHWYELETTFLRNRLYDGAVLEIKIGNGDWQDILAAGGAFLTGGYDGTIDGCCQNPLAGRLGWSGKSGQNQASEWITARAKLPASAAGQNVRLRFRVGTDIGTFREGQYIDDLAVTDGYFCECENASNAPFDFDGDHKTDLSVFNLNSGPEPDFRFITSSTNTESSALWGAAGDLPANADFDGDGKTDFAVFRPSEGTWYILRSSDGAYTILRFGVAGDLLVPADYDGDGKDDVGVFRASQGLWYVLRSSDAQVLISQFGQPGDKPVNNDFDGDGKTDIAVWRPSTGTWYIARSSDGGYDIGPFGILSDVPVSGDYDGDGRADMAVFRPSTGIWYLLRSTSGFTAVHFGISEDLPIQADFDGDGRADISVFRPSSKVWYHLRSSDAAASARLYGGAADSPVPAIYVNR
jgi:hypothetical protein